MGMVYRYTDLADGKIKYVGAIWSEKRTLKDRVEEHKKDAWCKDRKWKIEYLKREIKSRIDAELFKSHYISEYGTDKYFNIRKTDWGKSEVINSLNDEWEVYQIDATGTYKEHAIKKVCFRHGAIRFETYSCTFYIPGNLSFVYYNSKQFIGYAHTIFDYLTNGKGVKKYFISKKVREYFMDSPFDSFECTYKIAFLDELGKEIFAYGNDGTFEIYDKKYFDFLIEKEKLFIGMGLKNFKNSNDFFKMAYDETDLKVAICEESEVK